MESMVALVRFPGHPAMNPIWEDGCLGPTSRFFYDNTFRDKFPHRTLRKRLFKSINMSCGPFTLDGMATDDGHNALLGDFCCPSEPFFEHKLEGQKVWLFPPAEMIGLVLKLCIQQS